ncbi:MFS transporter [Catenulispora rubra]|uniref:MFS transporter n=1 Tax=Catenulispora rubra TaxID=280293 RepID=UPI0018922A6E|nr:MFS transporter [Catenulispora rubra]
MARPGDIPRPPFTALAATGPTAAAAPVNGAVPTDRAASVAPASAAGPAAAGIAARIERIPVGRFHHRLAGLLGAATFFDGFDAISIAVILAVVAARYHLTTGQAGLLVSYGYVGQLAGAVVIGAISDRFGRRPAFLLSVTVFGVLSAVCALAWNAPSLGTLRALQGLGLGAEIPVAGTLINEYLGARGRGRASVAYQSAFAWGMAVAPMAAIAAFDVAGHRDGWRLMLAAGALPLLLVPVAWRALPESARWLAERGRVQEARARVSDMENRARERGAVLAAPDDVSSPEDAPAPACRGLRPVEMLAGPYRVRTLMLAVVWFTTFFIAYGYAVWMPTLYIRVGHLTPTRALELTAALGLLQVAVVYLTASVADRIGRKPLLAASFAVMAAGGALGWIGVGLLGHHTWRMLIATAIVLVIGATPPTSVLYLYTAELYPTRMRGFATSTCSGVNRLASIVSPTLVGYLLGTHGSAGAVFFAFAAAAVLGLVVIVFAGLETTGRPLDEMSR